MRPLLVAACVLVAVASIARGARETRRPNVVFILVDDLGWADIGAFNPRTFYDTPNINRLAAEGMMFTNGYAANTNWSSATKTGAYTSTTWRPTWANETT